MVTRLLTGKICRLAFITAASMLVFSGSILAADRDEDDSLAAALGRARAERNEDFTDFSAAVSQRVRDNWQSMNPDISVIIDAVYQNDTSGHGLDDILEDLDGFGIGHSHNGGHAHDAGSGFSLREIELVFSADVDPYFTSDVVLGIHDDHIDIEEAYVTDTFMPGGLQFKAGKFYSNIGRINSQHVHDWDFVDRPLVNQQMFGDHGLQETGVQLSWLAPLERTHLLSGIEVFQGDNEVSFENDEGHSGPRLGTAWMKYSPDILPLNHEVQFGTFGGYGRNSEHHGSRIVDGYAHFAGVDMVYKYRRPGQHYGQGNFTLEGEYMQRRTSMDYLALRNERTVTEVIGTDSDGNDVTRDVTERFMNFNDPIVGSKQYDRQDGYYLQAIYGFAPRWRAGLRWDHVGLQNSSRRAHEAGKRSFDDSYRSSLMVDFTPSEFSRFRLQGGRGAYQHDGHTERVWDVQFQMIISLGVHGAHAF